MTAKNIFVTAGFGRYAGCAKRISLQSLKTCIFSQTMTWTEKKLKAEKEFWGEHKKFITKERFGNFIWKPYIISVELKKSRNGDVIFYCDSGCEINYNQKNTLEHWINNAKKYDITAFSSGTYWHNFTKDKLQKYFGISKNESQNKLMAAGGFLIIRNSPETRALIDNWYELCKKDDYCLLDDSLSEADKIKKDFYGHRHDQSILHGLLIKSPLNINFLSENLWRNDWRDAHDLPILALRNRHRFSVLPSALSKNQPRLPFWKRMVSELMTRTGL
ncbi:hypothetical protein [uncultured Thalassospira sp.]|uniref:hypothetical protein n=1 Tax=uncultured Thalassospira sp. TaxID=404382 RepID=UPI0030D82790|tara:strand:- start:3157 stop:3981 length:825 start_codon:yes stop_codon:yes gene_type:complete